MTNRFDSGWPARRRGSGRRAVRPSGGTRAPAPGRARYVVDALLAGAAGTAALNAVTYADMAVRGRAASQTPQRSVRRLADARLR
jgi:hypothetical protein